ncbi:hypothetical protein NG55_04430 [Acinetobacter gyllenbergii]|nr:hypothetical protein NG55_04430 [Acinetobacter gyllenbergii]
MVPNLTQVRQALKLLAERKGRPDYELCTAKEVKCALEHGLEHPLIKELPFFELEPREEDKPLKPVVKTHRVSKTRAARQKIEIDPEVKKELIDWLVSYKGSLAELGMLSKCSASLFSHIKTGKRGFSFDVYTRIMKARKELEGSAA